VRKRQKHRTTGGLTRETAYLFEDEECALEERAQRERCSKSEVVRRALRSYLGIKGAGPSVEMEPQSPFSPGELRGEFWAALQPWEPLPV